MNCINFFICYLGYHPLYLDSNGPTTGGQPGGNPPQSGYAELDTTLMPPRGAPMPQDQYRNTSSPRTTGAGGQAANHPGYAG